MSYLVFNPNGDYEGEKPETFGEHLQRIREWGDTPDCWDWSESLTEAKRLADDAPFKPAIVISELDDYRPVYQASN